MSAASRPWQGLGACAAVVVALSGCDSAAPDARVFTPDFTHCRAFNVVAKAETPAGLRAALLRNSPQLAEVSPVRTNSLGERTVALRNETGQAVNRLLVKRLQGQLVAGKRQGCL